MVSVVITPNYLFIGIDVQKQYKKKSELFKIKQFNSSSLNSNMKCVIVSIINFIFIFSNYFEIISVQHPISHIILSIVILDFRHSSLWPSPWLLPTPTMAMAATADMVEAMVDTAMVDTVAREKLNHTMDMEAMVDTDTGVKSRTKQCLMVSLIT